MATNQYNTSVNPTLAGVAGGTVTGLAASNVANNENRKSNAGLYAIIFGLLLVFGLFVTLFVFAK
jgi:hypothetical protein